MSQVPRAYATYKSSGVEWLDDVPVHWEVRRLRTVAEMRVSNVDKHTRKDEIPVRLCNYVDVYKNNRITPAMPFMTATASQGEIAKCRLQRGDVLITKDSEAWDDIGIPAFVAHSTDDLLSGYHLALLRPFNDMLGSYLAWALQSKAAAYQFHVRANGVTRYGLTHVGIQSVQIPLPSLAEQRAIVRYLDHVDRRSRRYVRAKENLIGLLEEEKQAIINQAVTRGLDPSVRLKASGVEWLGDVPEHWKVKKATQLFSMGSGTTPPTDALEYYGGDIPWITTSELRESVIVSTKQTVTRQALRRFSSLPVYPKGSVAVAMYGATIGRIGVLGVPATVNQACCVFSESREIDTWFWFYWLQSRRPHLVALGYGGGQPNLSQQLLKGLRVPVPSRNEQHAIVQHLDKSTSDVEAAIIRARRQIEPGGGIPHAAHCRRGDRQAGRAGGGG